MNYGNILASVLAAGLMVGCDDKKDVPTPPAPAQPAPQAEKSVAEKAKDALDQGKQQVSQAVEEAKSGGEKAVAEAKAEGARLADQAKVQGQQAVDQTRGAASQAKEAISEKLSQFTTSQAVSSPATSPVSDAAFDYKQKMNEAMSYFKEHKLDLADKSLAQVEQRKASIPVEYHAKIDSLRKMIDSARATRNTGINLPKF